MESTLKARETDDPHDAPAMAPDVIPAAWADRVLADITRDAVSIVPESKSSASSVAAPTVDTTFRPTAIGDIKVEGRPAPTSRWLRRLVMAMFALCSAILAAAWQHYGDTAKQMVAGYAPPFVLSALMPADNTAPVGQTSQPGAPAPMPDQGSAQPEAPVAPAETAAPSAAAPASDSAQLIQSMARDLAAMGQQIEQLKASVAELKAAQQPPVTPVAARALESRPPETKPAAPPPRPRISAALPPRPAPAAAPLRRPPSAYPPVQATAAPMQLTTAPPLAPPPPTAVDPGDEPVVRPPMPLR
jgi:hypothetical protein